MIGLYGRLLFGGGVLAVAGGVAILVRSYSWLRSSVGALGLVIALFTGWLAILEHLARMRWPANESSKSEGSEQSITRSSG